MKAVWIDAGNDANYDLLRKHGIDSPYFDPRDKRVTAAYLSKLATDGFKPGLYFAWGWNPTFTGPQFAEWVDNVLKAIGWHGNPPVCLNIETHDIAVWVVPCLKRWRELRPTRQTDWTMEGMQGATLEPFVADIIAANVRLAPQLYVGPMDPQPHSPVIDLLMAGIPGDRIIGMYDASKLPWRWNGYAFTQGRLPT